MIINFDTHIHSTLSCDGKDSMEDMVISAINRGLEYVCFTEHIDYNPLDFGYRFFDYEAYSKGLDSLRDKYQGSIEILKGIEFSEPHVYVKEFNSELCRDYDMVMAALHWMDDKFYGQEELLLEQMPEKILERYFMDLLDLVAGGGFDVLAHFDFPRRYYGRHRADESIIEQILKTMIENNIVPEINTSGFRKGYGYTLPDFDILDQYIELGGSRVTLGSDAHSTGEIAADFDKISGYHQFDRLECGIFRGREFVRL